MGNRSKYTVILENAGKNWGAYSPEVPGCYATGATKDETREKFKSAVAFHLESYRELGMEPPHPELSVETIDIAA